MICQPIVGLISMAFFALDTFGPGMVVVLHLWISIPHAVFNWRIRLEWFQRIHRKQFFQWYCSLLSRVWLQAQIQKEDAPLAGMRAQGILKPLMLRRTKNSRLVRYLLHMLHLDAHQICSGGQTDPWATTEGYKARHIALLSWGKRRKCSSISMLEIFLTRRVLVGVRFFREKEQD